MKRILFIAAVILAAAPALSAQSTSADHKARYDRHVRAVGAAGAGVETILDRWEAAFPEDPLMMEGRFRYLYTKSQTSKVVPKDQEKFMGMKPLLSLPDTTSPSGKKNFFEEIEFDADRYKEAMVCIDKAVRLAPDELRYRFDKISALASYEKESPDMATAEIRTLIDYDATSSPAWKCDGDPVDHEFFKAAIQEYCVAFYQTGSQVSFESFKEISEKMLSLNPKEPLFLNNIGSYWLIARDDSKQALKFYKKALKIKKDDYTAIRNIILMARNRKDTSLEKKYLPALIGCTPDEAEKLSAESRLEYLKKKCI